jgi:Na+/H+ antiporter NhaD/arsenite permease-like protein
MNERLGAQPEATALSSGSRSRSAGSPESSSVFALALAVGVIGGILAATQVVHLRRAMANYQWGVLCFFVSLDLFTSIIVTTGIMDRAALVLARRSRSMPLRVMLFFGTLLFLVSALMNNLTAVLIVLPIIFVLLRAMRLQRRFVAGFFAMLLAVSNLAGASTPIGDFPALIIMKSGLTSFVAYLARAFPLFAGTAVIVIVGHLILARSACRSARKKEEEYERAMSLALLRAKYRYVRIDYRAVTRIAVIFLLMFAAWATLPAGLVPPELVAVLGLSAAAVVGPRGGSVRLYRRFDLKPVITVGIFLFIAALVQDSGVLVWLAARLHASIEDPLLLFCAVMALTAACSGLFSAGPAAAAMMPLVVEMAHGPFSACSDWLAVGFAAAICAGSSLFVWSATAGLPLAHKVADAGLRDPTGGGLPWGVRQYLPYGIAHFVVQLSVGMACVVLAISGLLTEAGTAEVVRRPVWAHVLLDEQLFPEKDGECFWDEVEDVYLEDPARYGDPVLLTGVDSGVEPERLLATYGRPEKVEVRPGITWHGYGAFFLGIRPGDKTYTQVRAPAGFFLRGFRLKAELAIAESANGDERP